MPELSNDADDSNDKRKFVRSNMLPTSRAADARSRDFHPSPGTTGRGTEIVFE